MTNNKCMEVNMTACFYCGESTGVAIGKKLIDCENKRDTKYVFGGYEPCDKCKEQFDAGFLIIECQETPISEGQPQIQGGVYPTGSHWVVTNEAAENLFSIKTLKHRMVFVSKEIAEKVGLYQEEGELDDNI